MFLLMIKAGILSPGISE